MERTTAINRLTSVWEFYPEKHFKMLLTVISWIKVLVSISFLSILVVGDHVGLPMLFILIMGLISLGEGNPADFIISIFVLSSVVYLVLSVFIEGRKVNFFVSTISVTILSVLVIHSLYDKRGLYPGYSGASYLIFFGMALGYYACCLARTYQIFYSKK